VIRFLSRRIELRDVTQAAAAGLAIVLRFLSMLVLVLFLVVLALTFFVPLYMDEILTKVMDARFFAEHRTLVTLTPQCGASWVNPLPLAFYPGSIFVTLLYGGLELVGLKVSGIVLALAWFAGTGWLACRTATRKTERVRRFGIVAALLGCGVFPCVLVLARRESVMLLCLLAYCAFPIASRRWASTRWGGPVVATAFILTTSLFFFSHPKALFYLPFVLVSALATAPWRRGRSVVVIVPCVLVIATECVRFIAATVRCDDAPGLTKMWAALTLDPGLVARDPTAFFASGLTNLVETPERAWAGLMFRANTTGWVPLPRSARLPLDLLTLNSVTSATFAVFLVGMPVLLLLAAWRRRTGASLSNLALAASLALSVAANAFMLNDYAFYNSQLMLPAMALVVALVGWTPRGPVVPRTLASLGLLVLLPIACANFVAFVGYHGPALVQNAAKLGAEVPGQPLAIPIFGFGEQKARIRALASSCGLDGDGSTHLVIDETTFYAFHDLSQPINLMSISDAVNYTGQALPGEEVIFLLRRLQSPGIIGRCNLFPTALHPRALSSGSYCCVGKAALGTAPTSP
jgi:hypothetical protein